MVVTVYVYFLCSQSNVFSIYVNVKDLFNNRGDYRNKITTLSVDRKTRQPGWRFVS